MFHAAFLGMVGKPAGSSLGELMYRLVSAQLRMWMRVCAWLQWRHRSSLARPPPSAAAAASSSTHPHLLLSLAQDSMYGRPGAGLRRRFQGMVKRILDCQGWDEVRRRLQAQQLPVQLALHAHCCIAGASAASVVFGRRQCPAGLHQPQCGHLLHYLPQCSIPPCPRSLQALEIMGLMPLSPAAWTARLRCAWQNSLAKGYHDRRTNWDRWVGFGLVRWWGREPL
jgi:hypothetical protein